MKIIKVIPKEDGLPFSVNETGKVQNQKKWKGNPSTLLGFAKEPVAGDMKISIRDFIFHPTQAIGLYPVFKNKDRKWWTSKDAVEKFEVIKKEHIYAEVLDDRIADAKEMAQLILK